LTSRTVHSILYTSGILSPDARFVRPRGWLVVEWAEARSHLTAQVNRGSERR